MRDLTMRNLTFDTKVDMTGDVIRKLMIEAIGSIEDSVDKVSRVTCMVEGCHAAIIISMASFAIMDRDKKKAELLLEKSVDMFAVRIGTGLDKIRKLQPELAEFIPKATKSQEDMKKDVEDMVKQYG